MRKIGLAIAAVLLITVAIVEAAPNATSTPSNIPVPTATPDPVFLLEATMKELNCDQSDISAVVSETLKPAADPSFGIWESMVRDGLRPMPHLGRTASSTSFV